MIRRILERIRNYFDQTQVMSSIYEGIGKEVRINPRITLGDAVKELWADLDVALVGMGEEHQFYRVSVFRKVLDRLGINETNTQSALAYLNENKK